MSLRQAGAVPAAFGSRLAWPVGSQPVPQLAPAWPGRCLRPRRPTSASGWLCKAELVSCFHRTIVIGADGGSRTRTMLPSQDFKSCVSTCSTTSAGMAGHASDCPRGTGASPLSRRCRSMLSASVGARLPIGTMRVAVKGKAPLARGPMARRRMRVGRGYVMDASANRA